MKVINYNVIINKGLTRFLIWWGLVTALEVRALEQVSQALNKPLQDREFLDITLQIHCKVQYWKLLYSVMIPMKGHFNLSYFYLYF